MKPEDDLIRLAQQGDRQAFAALVRTHYALMFKCAWKWCGRRDDAEDIAQEAAIKLAENIRAYRFESAFTTWVYRIVINTAKDYYKAKNRRSARETPLYDDAVYVSAAPSPEQQLEARDTLAAVHALDEPYKETLMLVCWQGLSHREAGEILDCPEGTVSWRISEARKKISAFLGREKRHG
jgi:RNA polymerase sigma-70 factor (ECF subfamily)